MAEAPAQTSSSPPAEGTVAQVMRPALATDGTITEVERVFTGGAGSGTY